MTEEELLAEIEKEPFRPFRLHLVSGKVARWIAGELGGRLRCHRRGTHASSRRRTRARARFESAPISTSKSG